MPRCNKIIGLISHALCAVIFLVFFITPTQAALVATESAIVTATVPEQAFNPPHLISPGNNQITKDPNVTFVWLRPSPLPSSPLDHYDLYVDGEVFAQNISDSLTTSDYYFYYIHRDGNQFNLSLKGNLDEGYHTWKVIAYNNAGLSSESETWTFYIDSIPPHIELISADKNTLHWNTANPDTIPSVDQRYIYVTQNPLLTGKVEPYANLQFTLICPYGIPNCTSTTETFNYPSGNWQHRFYNLIPNQTYTVHLTSIDSAGNTIYFPQFYLIYFSGSLGSLITPIPTPPTPTSIITPPPSIPSVTPQPTEIVIPKMPHEIVIPSEFLPIPPRIPTPPPVIQKQAEEVKPFNFLPLILFLLVFGLPLHLAMSQFGTNTNIKYTFRFLFTLLFPFIGKKKYTTHPFTTIIFYDPQKTDKQWQTIITDINGHYSLKNEKPENFFIKCFSFNRIFKPVIIPSSLHEVICLYSLLEDRENSLKSLQRSSFTTRSIPLILAILTSSIALYFLPSYFLVIYLYLSLQAAFSEYFYPKYK